MVTFARNGRTLIIGAAAALLTGCVAPQAPGIAAGVMPQTSWRAPAASYDVVSAFRHGINGREPLAGLIAVNGTLYGTTRGGGLSGNGTVYRMSPSGARKVLYRFRGGVDGAHPQTALADVNGTLYGTTNTGGSSDDGTVYSVSTNGSEKILYSFAGGTDGADPQATLLNVNGTLYGTTVSGGLSGNGTVFSIRTSGMEKLLYSFAGGSGGANPEAGLADVNGTLYGTTYAGGSSGNGIVYSISTSGAENVLHTFSGGSDGANPQAGLVNVKGTLYGTTTVGGSGCAGFGCGTVYSISTTGTEKVVYRFLASPHDGQSPEADLISVKGTLYGTTSDGGPSDFGTVYSVTTRGTEKVLHAFHSRRGSDGIYPRAPVLYANGMLYGTTQFGGGPQNGPCISGCGSVFALSP